VFVAGSWNWKISSVSMALIFVSWTRLTLSRETIEWVETARYLGVTLDTHLTWSAHANQVVKKAAQRLDVHGPTLTGEAACPSQTVCCSTSSSSVLCWITRVRSEGPLFAATSGICKWYDPSVFALRLTHLGTLVTGKFTRIWGFHSSPTTSECGLRVSTQSWLMRGTPKFGNLEGTYADQGLTEVTHG
jgi:hypothetical protein